MDPSPFLGLTLRMDTREQDKNRLSRVQRYFEDLGGDVERGKIENFDYQITGEYGGLSLNAGIEYKTVDDLSGSWKILPERFARAILDVDHLALFIEGRISIIKHVDDGKYYVETSTSDATGELFPYTTYMSKTFQWNQSGIYCWQFNSIREFGPSIENWINHLTNVHHPMLQLERKDWRRDRFAFYQGIPGIGAKTALELTAHTALYWADHVDELISLAKPSKTKKILDFLGVEDV